MTALTIATVRSWRPQALHEAADGLSKATDALDDEIAAVKKAMGLATESWRGAAADAATERADRELKDGRVLADALRTARDVLSRGATDISSARADLLATVDGALAQGLRVADDGAVVAAPLPPVMSSPEQAGRAAAERAAAQSELDCAAGAVGSGVSLALQAVIAADQHTADALSRIEIPASMQTQVDEIMSRLATGAPLDGLLAWGIGGARLIQVGLKAKQVVGKYLALRGMLQGIAGASDIFKYGPADGGVLRFLMRSRAARLVGKAFLPLTFASGLIDVGTGGGYDGARGWAARGFGLAGAAGAGALMASGGMLGAGAAALVPLGPVGLGIAGAAVVGYGAWQLGNLVYDHREAIGKFASKTAEWTGDAAGAAWDAGAGAVSDATNWAGDRLSGAADLGKKLIPTKIPTPW